MDNNIEDEEYLKPFNTITNSQVITSSDLDFVTEEDNNNKKLYKRENKEKNTNLKHKVNLLN